MRVIRRSIVWEDTKEPLDVRFPYLTYEYLSVEQYRAAPARISFSIAGGYFKPPRVVTITWQDLVECKSSANSVDGP